MSKKVIIIIVEGSSDETLLIERLQELFSSTQIRFEAYRGDMFYNLDDFTNRTTMKNINHIICDFIKRIKRTRKYRDDDILGILHIIDTYGTYIPTESILIDKDQNKRTLYLTDSINVNSKKQKSNIIMRNLHRSKRINMLRKFRNTDRETYDFLKAEEKKKV